MKPQEPIITLKLTRLEHEILGTALKQLQEYEFEKLEVIAGRTRRKGKLMSDALRLIGALDKLRSALDDVVMGQFSDPGVERIYLGPLAEPATLEEVPRDIAAYLPRARRPNTRGQRLW